MDPKINEYPTLIPYICIKVNFFHTLRNCIDHCADVTGFYSRYSSSQIRHFGSLQKSGHPVSKLKLADPQKCSHIKL